jgi:HD-GYP domain-containing protein (c-di-GMP phosphodiesterase class II)
MSQQQPAAQNGNAPAGDHYLRHVVRVGDQRPITATEDIYSTTGVKLLAAGHHVNSALLERLLKHKLLRPIDHSTVIDGALDRAALIARARELLESNRHFSALVARRGGPDFLASCFGRTQLPNPIRNKLTVLAEQSPALLDHSLWFTMGAVFLGQDIGMGLVELRNVASAALLHDIGQLHIDHRILDPRERLDDALRRQVHSHPVIGYSIVRALDSYDKAVARAILEHHERIDGSGYPGGLRGADMSRAGRLLSFMEFGLGILQSAGARHLGIVIKTYAHQFDPEVTRAFWKFFNPETLSDRYPFDTRDIPALYDCLNGILEGWETVRRNVSAPAWQLAERDFIAIRRAFSSVGLVPALIDELAGATEQDSQAHLEACSVLREGLRQAREASEILSTAARTDAVMQQDTKALQWLENIVAALEAGCRPA